MRLIFSLCLIAAASSACMSDDVDGDSDYSPGIDPACMSSATMTSNAADGTIAGHGSVSCATATKIAIETCVQGSTNATQFDDLVCEKLTRADVMFLELQAVSPCDAFVLEPVAMFRTIVRASAGGRILADITSEPAECK